MNAAIHFEHWYQVRKLPCAERESYIRNLAAEATKALQGNDQDTAAFCLSVIDDLLNPDLYDIRRRCRTER